MNRALLSSKNMCWCTPQDFFDKLNEEFCFTLDAAAIRQREFSLARSLSMKKVAC